MTWTTNDLPSLDDLTVVVTGANTGIGLETAAALAGGGATVVLACRNPDKAAAARSDIEARRPRGRVETLRLDLASQAQLRSRTRPPRPWNASRGSTGSSTTPAS